MQSSHRLPRSPQVLIELGCTSKSAVDEYLGQTIDLATLMSILKPTIHTQQQ